MIDFCVVKVFMALLETKKKFLKLTKCPWVRNEYIPNERPFSFLVRNGERLLLLLETNNAFRIVTQTYLNSEHTIDFCAVKVFMVLLETKKEFLKLTKRPWVRNDYIPNEQCFIFCWKRTKFPFVVRNERRFKNLHGVVGNKERFSDKKFSTLLPINSLKFWSFW